LGEDFTDDVSFEATDDLAVGLAVFLALAEIGKCGRVITDANDRDAVEGGIGLSTAAAIKTEAVGFSARRRERADAAKLC